MHFRTPSLSVLTLILHSLIENVEAKKNVGERGMVGSCRIGDLAQILMLLSLKRSVSRHSLTVLKPIKI